MSCKTFILNAKTLFDPATAVFTCLSAYFLSSSDFPTQFSFTIIGAAFSIIANNAFHTHRYVKNIRKSQGKEAPFAMKLGWTLVACSVPTFFWSFYIYAAFSNYKKLQFSESGNSDLIIVISNCILYSNCTMSSNCELPKQCTLSPTSGYEASLGEIIASMGAYILPIIIRLAVGIWSLIAKKKLPQKDRELNIIASLQQRPTTQVEGISSPVDTAIAYQDFLKTVISLSCQKIPSAEIDSYKKSLEEILLTYPHITSEIEQIITDVFRPLPPVSSQRLVGIFSSRAQGARAFEDIETDLEADLYYA